MTKKKLGFNLIGIGLALIIFNIFVYATTSHTDFGNFVINYVEKPAFANNITILIIASTASWGIPLFLIFLGLLIIKMHTKE